MVWLGMRILSSVPWSFAGGISSVRSNSGGKLDATFLSRSESSGVSWGLPLYIGPSPVRSQSMLTLREVARHTNSVVGMDFLFFLL